MNPLRLVLALIYVSLFGLATVAQAAVGDIVTIAGGPIRDGLAENANVLYPAGVAVDSAGNIYIADTGNNRIRKISTTGIMSTVAGSAVAGWAGDRGPATSARLKAPTGVAVAANGDLYIADYGNSRIRKVSGGIITTFAGAGASDAALSGPLKAPFGIAINTGTGDIYFSDQDNHRVLKIAGSTITTYAGTGVSGLYVETQENMPATSVPLWSPAGLALDAVGNLYIAEKGNSVVRKVSTGGKISRFAGNGHFSWSGDGGDAVNAMLNAPTGVAVYNNDVYIADRINEIVRKVSGGIITTVAGRANSGGFDGDGGVATLAQMKHPTGIALDNKGNLYAVEQGTSRVRKISAAGQIIDTIAGGGAGDFYGNNGPATAASLNFPWDIGLKGADIYITDKDNHRIRKITAATGKITTIAGNGTGGLSGDDNAATAAALKTPRGIYVAANGDIYFADTGNHRIRKITAATGIISTVAGSDKGYAGDDGPAISAKLNSPSAVVLDSAGNLYIADEFNHVVRKVSNDGTIRTVAGTPTMPGYAGDGESATSASLYNPCGLAFDSAGNLYIADMVNNRIRRITLDGKIETVAGNGKSEYSGDGELATAAGLYFPAAVKVDASGNLYIVDQYNHRIRKVTASTKNISTVAGDGKWAYTGDNGPAIKASLAYPTGIAIDSSKNLIIADRANKVIRKVFATSALTPGAPTAVKATAGNARATVKFTAPTSNGGSAILGYTVSSNPAGGVDSNAGTTLLSHVVTGLKNGTPYTFTVTARNAGGTGPASLPSNKVVPATVPGPPLNVVGKPGNGQVILTFSPPATNGGSAILGYTVTSYPVGGVDAAAGTTSRTRTITGLKNGTAYIFTVKARNAMGTGAPSAGCKVIPALLPGAPIIGTATAGNARATVTFSPPASTGGSPILGYTVTSNPLGGVDSNAGSTLRSHVVTGLKNGTAYTFTVKAKNAVGTGPASAASNKVIPATVPGAPLNVVAKPGNAGATVTFSAPVSNGGSAITGYTVISNPLGGVDANAGSTLRTHIMTGLKNGTAYTFTVKAKNKMGTGPASLPSNKVTPTP